MSHSHIPSMHLDFRNLDEISGGERDFVAEVLMVFRTESEEFLRNAKDHLRHNDYFSLRRTAHAMKPTGSYIGVDHLTELLGSLEQLTASGDGPKITLILKEIEQLIAHIHEEIDSYLASGTK